MRLEERMPSRAGSHGDSPQSGESGRTGSPLLFFLGEPSRARPALEPGCGQRRSAGAWPHSYPTLPWSAGNPTSSLWFGD